MRIAVLQPRTSASAAVDAPALVSLVLRAADAGADYLIHPAVPSLAGMDEPGLDDALDRFAHCLSSREAAEGWALFEGDLPDGLGPMAFLSGDACLSGSVLLQALAASPASAVLMPGCESDLQAEAVLELALGLSESLAGLVVVADSVGAAVGSPGHGGTAVILLGEVLAEAGEGEDLLIVDVGVPVPAPAPRAALPQIPPLLLQRRAVHRGEKPVPDYPADLS
ncbi:MAG: hypothetical protein C0418_02105 [Coriobacteriaceae bacterium]|nr:hypothetical protein [Coriobacteriaceae bacterium]